MNMKNKYILLSALAIGFASCEPEFENEVNADYTAGEANFASYVAVGNSLTAGYMDGTVYRSGQANSFPKLLSEQFALVGGGAFTQPSYADDVNNIGGIVGVPGFDNRFIINADVRRYPSGTIYIGENGLPASQGLQRIAGTKTITLTPQATAFNNMGVPGAKSFHLTFPGYASANPYFARMATSSGATVLGDALTKQPTFFTNWIGSNDVLAYATSGGDGIDRFAAGDNNVVGYGFNDITSAGVFQGSYNAIMDGLIGGGAKGVVATIPSVTSIPYFTTVPYNPVTTYSLGRGVTDATTENAPNATVIATGQGVISQLNTQLFGPLKQALTAFGAGDRINLLSTTSPNPVLISDESLPNLSAQITAALTPALGAATAGAFGAIYGQARHATSNDLIILTASSAAAGGIGATITTAPASINRNGISFPLADKWVLVPSEKLAIANATQAFNTIIVNKVNAINANAGRTVVAVADMNAILNQLITGIRSENGDFYTANYFSGTSTEGRVLFSLDGVHPNARGYAVIANEVIKVINSSFKANIPLKDSFRYPGINVLPTNNL
jgi:lysophospholipase L1-like esterase